MKIIQCFLGVFLFLFGLRMGPDFNPNREPTVLVKKELRNGKLEGGPQKTIPRRPSRYFFNLIGSQIQNSKGAMAQCFWRSAMETQVSQQLQINWSANGNFHSVEFRPKVTKEVHSCFHGLIGRWGLPIHPALRPYSYKFTVSL